MERPCPHGHGRRGPREDTGAPSDLRWIDGFVKNIRPHVFVRKRDSLLILMPNQAYHLNESGIHLLSRTLAGEPIRRVLDRVMSKEDQNEERVREVSDFFCDIRALVMGCLGEGHGRRAVEQVPFSRRGSLLPVLSEIAVTYRCNLACRFCYAGCSCRKDSTRSTLTPDRSPFRRARGDASPHRPSEGRAVGGEGQMTAEEVEVVLRRIRNEAEVPSVSFTGGEPTMRDDLPKLIRSAVRIGLRVNLITNGTLLTDSLARQLRRSGLRSAQVSVEGPNVEVHDDLTGVPGSFDRTMHGIEALKGQGIYVHTHTTINRLNREHIEAMPALAKSLGLPRLSMNMVMPCGTAGTGETALRYSEIGPMVQSVKRTAREVGIEFMWYSPTPYCMFNPIAGGLGGKACAACDGLLSVAPNGDVLPCSSLTDPVGNLLNQSFEDVWNSERALYYRDREYVPEECRSCGHLDICSGACPMYWDAFGCEELLNTDETDGAQITQMECLEDE